MSLVVQERPGQDDPQLLAQAGGSHQASHIEEWERHKSVVARYLPRDLLTEELVSRVTNDVRETAETTLSAISIRLVYIVIAVSGALWLSGYFFGFETPSAGDSAGTIEWLLARFLEALAVFGWSEELTGNKYLLTLIASAIVALLSETSVSREVRRKTREFVEVIEQTRRVVRYAKQVFVGSGQIRFSYGSLGVWVRGGNLDLQIRWAAIADGILMVREEDGWRPTDKVSEATHFFIFLKPRSDSGKEEAAEFLVVPERFFNKPVDASSWNEFIADFHP